MKKTTLAAALAVLATGATALVATPGEAQPAPPKPDATITRAQAEAQVAAMFARADANGDGVIDQADRAAMQAKMFAGFDKDGDGQVTKAEMDAARAQRETKADDRKDDRREAWFARLDADKSGGISQAEFAAMRGSRGDRGPGKGMKPGGPGHEGHRMGGPGMGGPGMRGGGMGMLRTADANGDRRVTREEATAAAMQRFDAVDADKNGQITAAERETAMQAMRAAKPAPQGLGGERAPPPPSDDE